MKNVFVMMSIVLGSVLAQAGSVQFFNRVDVSTDAANVRLQNASIKYVATKTEVRQRPGCNSNGEAGEDCTQTIVLESQPAIEVIVDYRSSRDAMIDEGDRASTSVLLDPAKFSVADVDALKAAYPGWKHPFSRAGVDFVKKNLSVTANLVKREIQVVDMRNSKLCPINGESGEMQPGCTEHLVYKTDYTTVTEVVVSSK